MRPYFNSMKVDSIFCTEPIPMHTENQGRIQSHIKVNNMVKNLNINMMKEKIYINRKEEYLPLKLVHKINNEIFSKDHPYPTKNNFLKCIGIIYYKQIHEVHDHTGYVATGRSYWRKVYGGDYHKRVIGPLLDLGIIPLVTVDISNKCPSISTKRTMIRSDRRLR